MTQRAEHGWPRPIPLLSTRVIVDHIANRWCSARWHCQLGTHHASGIGQHFLACPRWPSRPLRHRRLHPLCGLRLPVVKLYEVRDEDCFVVQRPGGTPLTVPVWMTQPASADIRLVQSAQLPVSAFLELCRL
jgi:hypothetical protein